MKEGGRGTLIVIVMAIGVVLCVALGVYGWLAIHDVDTRQFLYFFGVSVAPSLAALFNLYKTHRVSQKTDQVIHQTNGVMNAKLAEIPDIVAEKTTEKVVEILPELLNDDGNGDSHARSV